ncbi:MAG: histidine phosphatase family protein [Armatimonadota bacterium]
MNELNAAPGTQFLLIRHGETQWNLDGRVQGHKDVALTPRGEEQARRLADWLAHEQLDALYSSDLLRARRTAEIIAAARPETPAEIRIDPRVREAGMGVFEGMTAQEMAASEHAAAYRAWREDALRNRPPGGETLEDLLRRCMAAVREMVEGHPGQSIAIVAHGGPVRAMTCGSLGLPMEIYPKLRVENASVARILFSEKGPILAGFNDVGHLKTASLAPRHVGWEEK